MSVDSEYSSYFSLSLAEIEIKEKDIGSCITYVREKKVVWDKQLRHGNKESLFLRPQQTSLPFSIQYWKDGECLLYTKKLIETGGHKNVLYAIDFNNERLFARVKPISMAGQSKIIKEAQIIDEFSGKSGIIQNHRTSFYPSKNDPNQMKFHMIQELYEDTFHICKYRSISVDEIKIIIFGLMEGLSTIHAKRLIHNDLKSQNILIQIDPKTNKVIKAVLCDLGETTYRSNFLPPFTPEKLEEAQRQEVDLMIYLFGSLYRSQKMEAPKFFKELSCIPEGVDQHPAVAAAEALKVLRERL